MKERELEVKVKIEDLENQVKLSYEKVKHLEVLLNKQTMQVETLVEHILEIVNKTVLESSIAALAPFSKRQECIEQES